MVMIEEITTNKTSKCLRYIVITIFELFFHVKWLKINLSDTFTLILSLSL